MAIHREKIEGRDVVLTIEQVFEQRGHDYRPLGFVARVSSAYQNTSDGLIPYQGEFVRDASEHTVIYETDTEAHAAAVAYATRRLKSV